MPGGRMRPPVFDESIGLLMSLVCPLPGIPSDHNPPVIPRTIIESVGANAHIGLPLSTEDVRKRDDEGIVPYRICGFAPTKSREIRILYFIFQKIMIK